MTLEAEFVPQVARYAKVTSCDSANPTYTTTSRETEVSAPGNRDAEAR